MAASVAPGRGFKLGPAKEGATLALFVVRPSYITPVDRLPSPALWLCRAMGAAAGPTAPRQLAPSLRAQLVQVVSALVPAPAAPH
jgi:hypothetical protein